MTEDLVPPTDMDKIVEQYVQVRDKMKAMNAAHEKALEEPKAIQEILAGSLQAMLDKTNSTSIKTKHGTCYVSTRYTASLPDPEVFMKFVIDNHLFDLIDRRANVTAVKDYVEEKKALPPGVNLTALKTIGVRRA